MKSGERRQIVSEDGTPFDAHFVVQEIGSAATATVSFESAGSSVRNTNFLDGLTSFFRQLGAGRVIVDGTRMGKDSRALTLPFPIHLSKVTDFDELRLRFTGSEGRKGTGFSTSATSRLDMDLRVDPPGLIADSLARVSRSVTGGTRKRDFPLPGDISSAGLEAAMDRIDQDGFDPHGANTTYAIIARGKAYPPLAVAAFAIEADGGGVAAPGSLRGDRQGRLFKLLEEAGCTILPLESPGDELIEADDAGDRVAGEVDPAGAEIPETYVVAGVRHRRLKSVCDAVRRRAGGRCEACGDVASFIRRSDGSPYLEVHHVIPLADGGADTVWNAAGICANCHARCHHGEDNRTYNARLYDLVPELRKSSSD